jgi:transposase
MKKSRYTEEQIAFALKQNEVGRSVAEICRKLGISEATFYKWKQKYAGLGPSYSYKPRFALISSRAACACRISKGLCTNFQP